MADNRNTAIIPRMQRTRLAPRVLAFGDVPFQADLPRLLGDLQDAAIAADRRACEAVVTSAVASGISTAQFADELIPEVAKRLGKMWERDEIGFADVSIASSRLQVLLRHLGTMWDGQQRAHPAAPTILLVASDYDQHTLGASVLAGKLRRTGYSVGLMLGASRQQVSERLRKAGADAVFVSGYRSDSLDHLRQMVESIKASTANPPPIIVGGNVLELKPDIAALTGADFATNDPDEAIKFCGLRVPQHMCATRTARN